MQVDFKMRSAIDDDLLPSFEIRKNAMLQYIEASKGWNEEDEMRQHIEDFNTDIMQMIIVDGKAAGVFESIAEDGIIQVHGLYITEKYRNNKIGSRVMTGLMRKAASKKNIIMLQVLKVNTRAKDFYIKLGFRILREDDLYYKMIYKKVE
jgi:putative acetyltransferase